MAAITPRQHAARRGVKSSRHYCACITEPVIATKCRRGRVAEYCFAVIYRDATMPANDMLPMRESIFAEEIFARQSRYTAANAILPPY